MKQTAADAFEDLAIKPRNLMFGRGKPGAARWWNGGDPVATAFFNGLSLTFPQGEAFFIDSVRHYRDAVPPAQALEIDAFIKQEAAHSREHAYFNRQVVDAGYDVSAIDAELTAGFAERKQNPPIVNLAMTVCFEHITAIFAHACLRSDRLFENAPAEAARLWRWHAIEEIEHKAVAYDTFLAATAGLSAFKRWRFRCLVMLNVTRVFARGRLRHMARLFRQDGLNNMATWARALRYLWIYPGVLRQMFPAWLSFFRPGFHPWQHDDRALVRAAEAKLDLPDTALKATA